MYETEYYFNVPQNPKYGWVYFLLQNSTKTVVEREMVERGMVEREIHGE